MYPIDFSEGRKKKKKPKFQMPEITGKVWACLAIPVALALVVVLYLDYSSVRHADKIIGEMTVAANEGDSRQRKRMRRIAGISPSSKIRGEKLYETYEFDRVLSFLGPRTTTIVYSVSGTVIDVVNSSEPKQHEAGN